MKNPQWVRLFLPWLVLAGWSHAAELSVRVLSAKNGSPVPEMLIHLIITDPAVKHVPENIIFSSRMYTDGEGTAKFHVDARVPGDALIDVLGLADYCSHRQYRAAEVFGTGVADKLLKSCPHRPLKKLVVQPRPGEIVMFSGEYTRWERRLYFPWPS